MLAPQLADPAPRRILVIKLGALGDFIHALHGFAAIRAAHKADHLTLLTTAPFAGLARAAPWFDAVLVDERAPWWNLRALQRTVGLIRGFDFVYDLQTSRRSSRYFRMAGGPPWSGIARGCSHPHANPDRDYLHTLERQREQLQFAGITQAPLPERDWLIALGERHGVSESYALLMPGGAGVGATKRWPVERYAQVARWLWESGLTPVVIGGAHEAALSATIRIACPEAVDLTGRTSIPDIAALGAAAAVAIGNDTGPVHLAASVGAPTVALFSSAGIPNQAAPRGPNGEWVPVLHRAQLRDLSVETVVAAITAELQAPHAPGPLWPRCFAPPGQSRAAERTSHRLAAR